MPHPASRQDNAIAQAAAEWVARRDRGLSLAEKRAFAEWENADPRHRAELSRIGGAWDRLDALDGDTDLEAMADAVVARARAQRLRRRTVRFAFAGLAAAAAIAVGVAAWNQWRTVDEPAPVFASENVKVIDSTLRRETLADGSIAELNGDSRIEVDFTPAERRVRLVEGEAHFIVAKNPERPFFVTAGAVTVRAVGTAFNVKLDPAAVEVLVTEGKVQLQHERAPVPPVGGASASGTAAPAIAAVAIASSDTAYAAPPASVAAARGPAVPAQSLVAGQRALIERAADSAGGALPTVAVADVRPTEIDEALGWQTTRLVFSNTALEEVVASFNRFNRHQLTIGDPKLRTRTLTGVFRADNLEGFVRLLKASVDVKAELRTPTETVLLPMR